MSPGILVLALMFGTSSWSALPLGMPPGERDAALMRTPSDGCLVYLEWASRSSGKPDAPGIDGLVADPEIKTFIEDVERAAVTSLREEMPPADAEVVFEHGLPTATALINRAGCFWLSLSTKELPPREDFPNFGVLLTRLKGAFIVDAGDEADAVEKHLAVLLQRAGIESPEKLERFVLPIPVPGGGLTLHRAGTRFLLTYGMGTLDHVLAGLETEAAQGLVADQRASDALARVKGERVGRVCWVDLAGIIEAADVIAGHSVSVAEIAGVLGLDGVRHFASVISVDGEGRIVSRSFLSTDGRRKGLLSLTAGRPLTPDDFAHIPADADLVAGFSLSGAEILDAVRQMVVQSDPGAGEQLDQTMQALDQELGIKAEEDLPEAFSGIVTLWDSPAAGGVVLSSPVLAIEVRDPQKAYEVTTQVMQVLKHALPGEMPNQFRKRAVLLGQQKFMDRTIYYVNTIGDDVPFAPSFCVTDTHLLAALNPQTLKAQLRFAASGGASLRDKLAAGSPVSERRLISYHQVDTAAAARMVYAAAPYVGQLMFSEIQSEGVSIDIFSLPSARAILPYVGTSHGFVEVTQEGIGCESVNGLPIPGISGLSTFLPTALFSVRRVNAPRPAINVEVQEAR